MVKMIQLKIIVDDKKGSNGACDAKAASIHEVSMMMALLNKYKNKLQKNFDKMAVAEFDTFKEE